MSSAAHTVVDETIRAVVPASVEHRRRARARLDQLTKPVGSLGRLEDLAADYAAMTWEDRPKVPQAAIVTFAADHGVTEEGISAYPASVTAEMIATFLRGGAGVNVLAAHVGAQVRVVDIGVARDLGVVPGLIARKVAAGTRNLAKEPALSREQALQAMAVGIEMAREAAIEGIGVLGTGDMGIGNTTASAAITAVLTRHPVSAVTGRGTGIDEAAWRRKVGLVEQALVRHRPDPDDPLEVLSKVGGLEIGGLAGFMLGAARHRLPIVLDGFIAGAAALIAVGLQPRVREYLIASHRSAEPGHDAALAQLQLQPLLDLQLRLGEGSGACLGIGLLLAAVKLLTQMATFEEAGVSRRRA